MSTASATGDRDPRAPLDHVRPALPARALGALAFTTDGAPGTPFVPGQRQPALGPPEAEAAALVELVQHAVDEVARPADERGDDGQRREHRREDGGRRAERHAVHEAQAEQQQPEQGDDHGDRGEHDRPPRRVDRHLDRPVAIEAVADLRAVARDDEQRVVDADAQADERGQLEAKSACRPMADERDDAERRAEGQQGRDQRQPGGTSEPKVMSRTIGGGDDPEELRRALALLEAHDLGAGPAVLDLQLRTARREARVLDLLERRGLMSLVLFFVGQVGDADAPVLGQLASGGERALDARPDGCWPATFFSAASIRALMPGP
jgi:hypothetical protein